MYQYKIAVFGIYAILRLITLVSGINSFYGYATNGIIGMFPQNSADVVIPGNITTYECLLKCGENIECMSIFTNNGQCHHFYGGFVDNTVLSPSPGWKFYNVYTDGCPVRNGYIHNRQLNLCYKLHLGGTRDSYQFMATCNSEGGDLMRITSQEIQDHISAFLADATCHFVILIQGSDRDSEGTFKFEDGTVLEYNSWYGDEPNNHNGDEDFIFLVPDEGFRWGGRNRCCLNGFFFHLSDTVAVKGLAENTVCLEARLDIIYCDFGKLKLLCSRIRLSCTFSRLFRVRNINEV